MRIAGLFNLYIPTTINCLNLSNVKRADVEVKDTPKSPQKNVYTYVDGFERYSNTTVNENIENLRTMLRDINPNDADWELVTLATSTGETVQVKYNKSVNLQIGNKLDLKI